jgi:hypothetical protein
MKITFFDRQKESNPHNEGVVNTTNELLDILEGLQGRDPFFCELVGENGFNLLLGVGGEVSCAQYSASDGSTPYVVAKLGSNAETDGDAEFLINDTITPILHRYCIPFEIATKVAADFLETGQPSPLVSWEEI